MTDYGFADMLIDNSYASENDYYQYYSIEIPVTALGIVYQFKVWETTPSSMRILVREDSGLLPWLKKGSRLEMKYYSINPSHPYQEHETEVMDVRKQVCGRLRGHYLADLEIREHDFRQKFCGHYHAKEAQILPFKVSFGGIKAG